MANNEVQKSCQWSDICKMYKTQCWFEAQARGIDIHPTQVAGTRLELETNPELDKCLNKAKVCALLGLQVEDIGRYDKFGNRKSSSK